MDHSLLSEIRFETPRLLVRRLGMEDADCMFAMMSDFDTCMEDGGYQPLKAMDEAFWRDMRLMAQETDRFAVVRLDTNETIGTIHLMDPIPERAVSGLEIGYCMHPNMRRQGYASEAVAAMVHHLHDCLNIRMITASAFDFNLKSQHMLEKLGFEREGITRCAMCHPQHGIIDMVNYTHIKAE